MAQSDDNNLLGRSCSRLEEIANEARKNLLLQNVYFNESSKKYDVNHPNANQSQGGVDDRLNIKGKGTFGGYLDTTNGGGYYDINGRPDVDGSGRNRLLAKNLYNRDKPYDCYVDII
jgi:hypothetical protein